MEWSWVQEGTVGQVIADMIVGVERKPVKHCSLLADVIDILYWFAL